MGKNSINIFFILIICVSLNGQTITKKTASKFKTSKYAGVYAYGTSPEEGPTGQITIYAESDDSLLFYMDISRGEPSYNMGNLYDRIKIKSNTWIYYYKDEDYEGACKFSFVFSDNKLIVKTIDRAYDCGFGGFVKADGVYYKVKNAKSDNFIDMTGTKYYFSKTKPEVYAKILK